jgi:hypothetical protein
VDDVLILGSGNIDYWKTLKVILSKFCEATGLSINLHKSVFIIGLFDGCPWEADSPWQHQSYKVYQSIGLAWQKL